MKAQLETIPIQRGVTSFHFFEKKVHRFESYWHYHPEIELTYILRGQGLRFVGDHITAFESGELVMLGENLPHNWVSEKHSTREDHVAYVFQFPKTLFQFFPECKGFTEMFKKARYGLHFKRLPPYFSREIEAIGGKSRIKQLIFLLEVLHHLSEEREYITLSDIAYNKRGAFDKHQSRVARVTSYILSHFDEPLSLDQVARFSGMTTPSFCRWFKQSVGKSFVTYLNTIRIERACWHLLHTDWPVAQIAFQTGFESLSNFNRTFRKIKGEAPSQYRKKNMRHAKILD